MGKLKYTKFKVYNEKIAVQKNQIRVKPCIWIFLLFHTALGSAIFWWKSLHPKQGKNVNFSTNKFLHQKNLHKKPYHLKLA